MVFAHCEALSLGREVLRSPVPGQRLEVLGALKALFEAGAFQGCSLRWKIDWKFWLYDTIEIIRDLILYQIPQIYSYMIIMIQSGIIIYLGKNYDTSDFFFFFSRRHLVYVYIYMYMQIGAVFMTVKLQEGTTHLLMVSSSFNLSDNGDFAGHDSMFWEKRNKFWQTYPRIAELRPKVPCKGP